MKYVKRILVLAAVIVSSVANAGVDSSGGGGAWVCRNAQGEITTSHLLDLWEAANLYKLPVQLSSAPVETQLKSAIAKLSRADAGLASRTEALNKELFQNANYLTGDVELAPPTDANPNYQKKGCPLSGMMFYDADIEQLQIDRNVFDKLASNTDIAAAQMHEGLYYAIREMGYTSDSVAVRKLVGCLFSSEDKCLFPASSAQIIADSSEVYKCENDEFSYFLLRSAPLASEMIQSCGFTDADWIGMVDRIGNKNFSEPTLFHADLGTGPGEIMRGSNPTCSALSSQGYPSVWFQEIRSYRPTEKDVPLLSGFITTVQPNDTYVHLGAPTCKRIK